MKREAGGIILFFFLFFFFLFQILFEAAVCMYLISATDIHVLLHTYYVVVPMYVCMYVCIL